MNKNITKIQEINEINRDKGEMLRPEEYDGMKIMIFKDLDYTDYGWETARHALDRFKKAIQDINNKYTNKKILIIAHGTVMSLFLAHLQNKLDDVFSRWKSLDFCVYGIIKNNKVERDIVQ